MKQSTKEVGTRNEGRMTGSVMGSGSAEKPSVAAAMVDALEDILQWERASERAMKVAAKVT